jgi:hypothetical protein
MSHTLLGRCSKCGGAVTVPHAWYGVTPAIPTCQACGARKKNDLPIIEMESDGDTRQLLNEGN